MEPHISIFHHEPQNCFDSAKYLRDLLAYPALTAVAGFVIGKSFEISSLARIGLAIGLPVAASLLVTRSVRSSCQRLTHNAQALKKATGVCASSAGFLSGSASNIACMVVDRFIDPSHKLAAGSIGMPLALALFTAGTAYYLSRHYAGRIRRLAPTA